MSSRRYTEAEEAFNSGGDLMHRIECELNDTRRVRGALRAVQCLVQPWRHGEAGDVENVSREDLAQLLEVIHCDLTDRLDALERQVNELQGFGGVAAKAMAAMRQGRAPDA